MIKALSGKCTKSQPQHCSNNLQTNSLTNCERNIITNENSSLCAFHRAKINTNHIEVIPELGQFLAVFPDEEKLQIRCKNEMETKVLQGIFLIKENACKIIFKGSELPLQSTSYGKPIIINTPKLEVKMKELPKFSIELNKLSLQEVPVNPVSPIIQTTNSSHIYIPSGWTIVLYLSIFGVFLYWRWKKIRKTPKQPAAVPTTTTEVHIESIPLRKLPGDASF